MVHNMNMFSFHVTMMIGPHKGFSVFSLALIIFMKYGNHYFQKWLLIYIFYLAESNGNIKDQAYSRRLISKAAWNAMSRFYVTNFKEEDRQLALAKCASECLKRDCLMYRRDNSTGKCLFVYNDPKMCNGDVITNDLPGEKIAIYEKRRYGTNENMCSYKGLSCFLS